MSDQHDQKSALVPRLRFPEFREDWRIVTVGDFFDLADKPEKTTIFDKNKALTVKLRAKGVVKSEKTTLAGGANYFNRRAGQFVFSKIDLLNGAFGVIPDELDGFASSSDVPAYSFNAKQSSIFFVNWLKANYEQLEIERTGTSSTLKRVSPEDFLRLPVPAPTFGEQQKIADCLSSLDELIAAEAQKLDALKTHKKGLMQQLFPAEGETVPRLRFPEFREAGEWEVKPLGIICNVLNNKRQPIASAQRNAGIYPYYGASGIVDYVNDYIFDERLVLVGEDGAKWGPFEATAFIAEGKYWVNNHAHVLKPIDINDVLLENYLTMIDLAPYVTGAAPPKLTLAKLKSIPVTFPNSIEEQQKIADCLSALDDLIVAQAQKIELLKRHKKGLMQQLFPVLDEVGA